MDIDKLYYFFAAAESESFTKAADRCHIAQTTMSKYHCPAGKGNGLHPFPSFQEQTFSHKGRPPVL